MKTCIGFMFWGALLVGLDLTSETFDFVPHLVGALGFALIAIGTGGLAPMTGHFVVACAAGWLLVLANMVRPYLASDLVPAIHVVMTVVNCVTMWTTLAGVQAIAVGRGRRELAAWAVPLGWAYVAVVMSYLALWRAPLSYNVARTLSYVILAAAAVVMVLILRLLYGAWRRLSM